MKICTTCHVEKGEDAFARRVGGRASRCKPCTNAYNSKYYGSNRESLLTKKRSQYRTETPQVRHTRHIKSYYNLTTADYDRMLAAQGGVCAVCKQPPSGRNILHVDHDHRCCPAGKTCGKCIRGLLCHFCNTAIGLLDDSPKLTKSATEYLERN